MRFIRVISNIPFLIQIHFYIYLFITLRCLLKDLPFNNQLLSLALIA